MASFTFKTAPPPTTLSRGLKCHTAFHTPGALEVLLLCTYTIHPTPGVTTLDHQSYVDIA